LAIVFSVLQFTAYDYPFDIFKPLLYTPQHLRHEHYIYSENMNPLTKQLGVKTNRTSFKGSIRR
jgi:hypothetical protein